MGGGGQTYWRAKSNFMYTEKLRRLRSQENISIVAYCDKCDMELASCPHGLSERQATATTSVTTLLISPNGFAHFPGCPHKGDHSDYRHWGELDAPNAWQRLGNGEHLRATGGQRSDRLAMARCQGCLSHGPW